MKYKLLEISDWEKDEREMLADTGHISNGDIKRRELSEYETKIEGGDWPGLPFECEASCKDDAIEQYNFKFCRYDYYKATDADFEIEEER